MNPSTGRAISLLKNQTDCVEKNFYCVLEVDNID